MSRFSRVAEGIYREDDSGHLYERPWVHGRRTWRRLASITIKTARAEISARRADHGRAKLDLAEDPYAPKTATSVGQILDAYVAAGCPDARRQQREGRQLDQEKWRCNNLMKWWANRPASVTAKDVDAYAEQRMRSSARHAGRAAEMEISTLRSAFRHAARTLLVRANQFDSIPTHTYHSKNVRHARDCAPADADELHRLADFLFDTQVSEVLAWQLLLEGLTGCRTSEVLRLRLDATNRRPGHIEPGANGQKCLWIERSKRGVNNFILITPVMEELLVAMLHWRDTRHPGSLWFLPGRAGDGPVTPLALCRALGRVTKALRLPTRTSHGLRAFYVTTRRGQGISDAQIAAEIGDQTGASIIATTYGAVPPNWRADKEPSWLPSSGPAAWAVWTPPANVTPICSPLRIPL